MGRSALRKLGQIWYFAYYNRQNWCCQPIQTGCFLVHLHKEMHFFSTKGVVRSMGFSTDRWSKPKCEKLMNFRDFAKKNHKICEKRSRFGLKITIYWQKW